MVVFAANTRHAPPPRRWSRLFFTDTALGRRLQLRDVLIAAIGSSAARPARASPRGEPADRPRNTRALAGLAWLSSRPTRDALHPTPLAEALLHRHHARSTAAASNVDVTASDYRVARPASAAPCGEPADDQGSTRALADLAWLSSRPTRDALHPTPLAEALLHRHHARSTAAASKRRCLRVRLSCARDPRALRPVENRPMTKGARARWRTWRGCLCGQHATRSTPTPLVEALLHRHRPRSAAAASR